MPVKCVTCLEMGVKRDAQVRGGGQKGFRADNSQHGTGVEGSSHPLHKRLPPEVRAFYFSL